MRNAIVNSIRQGIRQSIRGSGEPVPTFGLPLKDSLDTNIASTRAPATFTRDSAGEQIDEQGKSNQVLSNESRHDGARRVENLITASEDMTNGAYTLDTGVTATATEVTFTGTANDFIYQPVTITDDGSGAGGRTFVFTAYVRLVSGTISSDAAINFNLSGSAISSVSEDIGDEITSTTQRFSVTASTDAAGTAVNATIYCDDAVTLEITKWQLEEVTGQLNQNPGEYVSTGVGTGSDIRWDLTTSSVLDSPWSADSAYVASIDGSQGGTVFIGNNSTAVIGKDYTVSYTISDYTAGNFAMSFDGGNANINRSSNGTYVETQVVSANQLIYLRADSSFDGTVTINSIKEADHGANRDGVKYFPYHNGNTKAIRKFLDLDGTGDYASSPDSSAASITGDISLPVYVRANDYSNGVQTLISKYITGTDQRSFRVDITGSQEIDVYISTLGTAVSTPQATSSTLSGVWTDGEGIWLMPQVDVSASTCTVKYSFDPPDTEYSDITWTTHEADIAFSASIAAGIFDSTSPVELGSINAGAGNALAGSIFRAAVISGLDETATPALDFNAEDHSSGSTLTSSTTGEVWTLNADAFIDNEETGVVTEAQGPAINSSTSQRMMLDGASGTYASTGDSASHPTGDTTLIAWIAPDDAAPSAAKQIVAKRTSGQEAFIFYLDTSGELRFAWWESSTLKGNTGSGDSIESADGEGIWARVTLDASTGDYSYYTSRQPLGTAVSSLSWAQLGSTQSISASTSIDDTTAGIEVGSAIGGTNGNFNGSIARAVVIASTDPTADPVVDFNANDFEAGDTWETQSQKAANSNEITNAGGPFTSTTGWTEGDAASSLSVVSGNLRITNGDSGGGAYASDAFVPTVGKSYVATIVVAAVAATDDARFLCGGYDTSGTLGVGTHVLPFTATTTASPILSVGTTGSDTEYAEFTSVSIIEQPDIWTLNGTAKVFSPFNQIGDLPGSSGDYFSTPDSAANSDLNNGFAGAVWAAADDWTPGSAQMLMAKHLNTGNARDFRFRLDIAGTLYLDTYADGSSQDIAATSSVATGFSNTTGHWVGFTVSSSTGDTKFYTSDDSPLTPLNEITWTQLGETQSGTWADLTVLTAVLEVGSINNGTSGVFQGKIARAALINTDDLSATPVADMDARAGTPGVSTFTASTGEVWTANGNTAIEGGHPVALFDEGGPLGIRIEEARTNLALYSQNLNGAWNNINSVDVQNYAIAPDGTKTANRLIDDSSTGTSTVRVWDGITVATSTAYTMSGYFKADQLEWLYFQFSANGSLTIHVSFDLTNGLVGTTSADVDSRGIEPVGNGWYRCWITFTSDSSDTTGDMQVYVADADDDPQVALDGTSSILVWGLQLEAGSFPTTYIPTTSSSATRNADVLTYSATGNATAAAGTVYAEATISRFNPADATNYHMVSVYDTSIVTDSAVLRVSASGTAAPVGFSYSGSSLVANLTPSTPEVIEGITFTGTYTWAANDFELYNNGVSLASDTSGAAPTALTTMDVGHNNSTQFFNGHIRNVKIYNRRLNDTQVSNL